MIQNNEPFRAGAGYVTLQTDWTRVLEQVPQILSPKQREGFMRAYQVLVTGPQDMEKIGKRMGNLFGAGE